MDYRDLVVSQKSMDLVTEIDKVTATLPSEERFGLSSQMRRSAVSIPSNIAEGHGRKATGSDLNHISIAYGSLMELETQAQICERLNFLPSGEVVTIIEKISEIARMLNGLKKSLSVKET